MSPQSVSTNTCLIQLMNLGIKGFLAKALSEILELLKQPDLRSCFAPLQM
jgi:hypothetical protein